MHCLVALVVCFISQIVETRSKYHMFPEHLLLQKQNIAKLRGNDLLSLGHVSDQVNTSWEKTSFVKLIIHP